jgi:acyl-CoA synthetase (NDP forming)
VSAPAAPAASDCGGVGSLLLPAAIAVVGASPRQPRLIDNLSGHDVPVWGVHQSRTEACGIPCFPSVADLPERPELAVQLVGHQRVEAAFADAVAAGVRPVRVEGGTTPSIPDRS